MTKTVRARYTLEFKQEAVCPWVGRAACFRARWVPAEQAARLVGLTSPAAFDTQPADD